MTSSAVERSLGASASELVGVADAREWEPYRPGDVPALEQGDVHVWWLSLDVAEALQASMTALLPASERAELERIRGDAELRRATVSRAWRRRVLAAYTGEPAAALRFGRRRSGKPALFGDVNSVRFSAARHGADAVLAVSRRFDVGVDLEAIDLALQVRRDGWWLPATDAASLRELAPAARASAFTREWVLLEARAKVHGTGLARTAELLAYGVPWAETFRGATLPTRETAVLLGALACALPPKRIRWLLPRTD